MLAQGEQHALDEQVLEPSTSSISSDTAIPHDLTEQEPVRQQEPQDVLSLPGDDEEESFFGPAWLKSLGATTINADAQPEQQSQIGQTSQEMPAREEAHVVLEQSLPEHIQSSALPFIEMSQEATSGVGQTPESPEPNQYEWMNALSAFSSQDQQEAQNLLTTLESLEQNLRQQGFIPLEPNTLSTIAQSQQSHEHVLNDVSAMPEQQPEQEPTNGYAQEQEPRTPTFDAYTAQDQDAMLSSVLARLGNHTAKPETAHVEPVFEEVLSEQEGQRRASDTAISSQEESLWIKSLGSVPSPAPHATENAGDGITASAPPVESLEPEHAMSVQPHPVELPAALSFAMPVEQTPQVVQEKQEEREASQEVQQTQQIRPVRQKNVEEMRKVDVPAVSEPSRSPSLQSPLTLPVPVPQGERQRPAASLHDVFSDDLEVTMKRPAIRLQPMQSGSKLPQPPVASISPALSSPAMQGKRIEAHEQKEQRPTTRSDGTSSYRERLQRGYQHQLVGDYDEAMQEYRVIIRNAPVLLDEVVSNVRALLKLAPKYSAGYRVLGDAYMRQGEYLQAMDAYNQALTITKKARV
jgi:hypothetical protein